MPKLNPSGCCTHTLRQLYTPSPLFAVSLHVSGGFHSVTAAQLSPLLCQIPSNFLLTEMLTLAMFTGLSARYWSKQEADKAAQKKKTAAPNVPNKKPQPSSSAAAAAKQLGFAASTSVDPKANYLPGSQSTPDRSTKRNHDEAFASSSRQDVHKPFRLGEDQLKKPEYPRRGAPPDAITRPNEPPTEVMSISSDDEDRPDSDDEPLITHKRRITSSSPSRRHLKDEVDRQSIEIRSLTKQLRDSQAMYEKVKHDQAAKDDQILNLSQRLDLETGRVRSLTSQNDALKDNIANIRNRASREREDASRATSELGKKAEDLHHRVFDEAMRCKNLEQQVTDFQRKEESSKATAAKVTGLEVSNQQLRARNSEVEQLHSDLTDKYNQLKVQYDNLDVEYGKWGAEYEKLQAEHDELESENNNLEAKVTGLKQDNDHQNLRLHTLEKQLEEQKARADQALADDSATRKIEELERQLASQRDELQENEKKLLDLREELSGNEKSREDREKQWQSVWDARIAMEDKWRKDLLAIKNDNNMFAAERMRAGPAAPGPTQQTGQEEMPRNVASQQSAAQRDAAQRDASRGSSSRIGGASR